MENPNKKNRLVLFVSEKRRSYTIAASISAGLMQMILSSHLGWMPWETPWLISPPSSTPRSFPGLAAGAAPAFLVGVAWKVRRFHFSALLSTLPRRLALKPLTMLSSVKVLRTRVGRTGADSSSRST